MEALRTAVIGLGAGMHHARAYHQHPGCTLAAVCDADPSRRAETEAAFPGVPFYTRAEDILCGGMTEAVSIATYDDTHFPLAMQAIGHGVHVFAEKPLCTSEPEALQLRRALEAHPGVRLSSNLILRASPRFQRLKRHIASGDMGGIYSLDADYLYGRPHKLTGGWRGKQSGYSLVLGGMIHMIDLALWLTEARPTEVKTYANNIATRDTGFTGHDLVSALVRFDTGMIARLSVHGSCMRPHFHGLSVFGTNATFTHTETEAAYYTSRELGAAPETWTAPYPGYDKGALAVDFIDAIVENREPEVTADDALRTMAVCFAVERSINERCAVEVRYV